MHFWYYCNPGIIDCRFIRNSIENNQGGGIYCGNYSNPIIMNCSFEEHFASIGAGIYCYWFSTPVITNCVFSNNSAAIYGGGMSNANSNPVLSNCQFNENSANLGGGIYNNNSDPKLISCIVNDNIADFHGGGMYNYDSNPTLVNCIFYDNTAKLRGGGMANYGVSYPLISNCTLFGNAAWLEGGGIYSSLDSSPTVTNSVLWGNSDFDGIDQSAQVDGGIPNVMFSCIQDDDPDDGYIPFGGASNSNIDDEPLFLDALGPDALPYSGDEDLHLSAGSPCIDAGDNSSVPEDVTDLDNDGNTVEPIPWDLDGNPRFVYEIVDMGAYERQTIIRNITQSTFHETLQEAIDAAFYGDEIWVAAGTYTPTEPGGDRQATFQLENGVAIYGGFPTGRSGWELRDPSVYKTILSGDLNKDDVAVNEPLELLTDSSRDENSYHVAMSSNNDANTILDGFDISNGNANDSSGVHASGGGIYINNYSNLTIANCTFSGNSARNYGGAICNNGHSHPRLNNCSFLGNATNNHGAGIYVGYMTNPTLTNCVFSGNASAFTSGGITVFGSSPRIENCVLQNNSAQVRGGGMYVLNTGSPILSNCTFTGNIANSGGGMYSSSSDPTIVSCIFWDNMDSAGTDESAQITVDGGTVVVKHSCIQGGDPNDIYIPFGGMSNYNIDDNPLFIDPNGPDGDPDTWEDNDYHLKSQAGRWDTNSESWVTDSVSSLCIDAGDPNSDWTGELWPHGKRNNMGAYGGTAEASMSSCGIGYNTDFNNDGIVNGLDFDLLSGNWQKNEVLLAEDVDRDGWVGFSDLITFFGDWLMTDNGMMDCSPVGWWRFDETSGLTAQDSSNYGNHGTLINGPVWTGDGKLLFDGVDDYVEVPDSDSLDLDNDITISAWVYLNTYIEDWPKIVIKPHSAYDEPWEMYCIDLSHFGRYPRFLVTDGVAGGGLALAYDDTIILSLNQWYHIAGTYDGSMISLYLDGQLLDSRSSTISIGTNTMPVSIGGRLGTNNSFDGQIDEVRMYNRSLTEEEVIDLFNE